jgi:DNA modification methylase
MGDGFTYYRLYCFWGGPCSNNITVSAMNPYYSEDGITIYHGDCREILPTFPDKSFDLVLTDPPYGIGESNEKNLSRVRLAKPKNYGTYDWDKDVVSQSLIDSAVTLGVYACVWGGNYYSMPPSPCWLIWDKLNGKNDFADCEIAWTNYGRAVRLRRHLWNGMLRKDSEDRHHPTQKPLQIITWAVGLSPQSDSILDPFMGSGTTLVAAKQLGRKAVGIEIEEKYCEIAVKRLAQMELFK